MICNMSLSRKRVYTGLAGIIEYWPTESIPTGYLICDGSAVSRATYAELYTSIRTRYGAGDGSTTFNLPDFRGYFLRFQALGTEYYGREKDVYSRIARPDGFFGDVVGSKQHQDVGDHYHFGTSADSATFGFNAWQPRRAIGSSSNAAPINFTSSGNETRPVNVNLIAIIRYIP